MLTDAPAERGRALAIEIALQTVPDRLVEQDAGPPGSEYDRHRARGRRHGIELHDGLPNGFPRILHGFVARQEIVEIGTGATTRVALLPAATLLEDDADVEAHKRPDVGRKRSVRGSDKHHIVTARQADHDLLDTRVERSRSALDFTEKRYLLRITDTRCRIRRRIERHRRTAAPCLQRPRLALAGNSPRRRRCLLQRWEHHLIGVGEAGLLPAHGPHADPLVKTETALTNNAVLDGPAFLAADLEIQVGVVNAAAHHGTQRRIQLLFVKTHRLQRARNDRFNGPMLFVTQFALPVA